MNRPTPNFDIPSVVDPVDYLASAVEEGKAAMSTFAPLMTFPTIHVPFRWRALGWTLNWVWLAARRTHFALDEAAGVSGRLADRIDRAVAWAYSQTR